MISSLLHLFGLRPRVYYTLTNFRGGGQGPLGPPLNTPMAHNCLWKYFPSTSTIDFHPVRNEYVLINSKELLGYLNWKPLITWKKKIHKILLELKCCCCCCCCCCVSMGRGGGGGGASMHADNYMSIYESYTQYYVADVCLYHVCNFMAVTN